MEKEPAFASCRVHKLSALAPGPSLLAGIAAGANYSADGFIANFLMGPGLSDSVFISGYSSFSALSFLVLLGFQWVFDWKWICCGERGGVREALAGKIT